MGSLVEYRTDNGVAVLELNNPPVNSYTYELLREFDDTICQARMDENVHVLVIRGKGEKFFSAGADINMLAGKSSGWSTRPSSSSPRSTATRSAAGSRSPWPATSGSPKRMRGASAWPR